MHHSPRTASPPHGENSILSCLYFINEVVTNLNNAYPVCREKGGTDRKVGSSFAALPSELQLVFIDFADAQAVEATAVGHAAGTIAEQNISLRGLKDYRVAEAAFLIPFNRLIGMHRIFLPIQNGKRKGRTSGRPHALDRLGSPVIIRDRIPNGKRPPVRKTLDAHRGGRGGKEGGARQIPS